MTIPTVVSAPTDWLGILGVFKERSNSDLLWIVIQLLIALADELPLGQMRVPTDTRQITIEIKPKPTES